jgi:hypothetical protein
MKQEAPLMQRGFSCFGGCLLLAVISMGQRNTRWKSSCLVFSPEGFAGVSEGLAQQTLAMIEWKAQIVG